MEKWLKIESEKKTLSENKSFPSKKALSILIKTQILCCSNLNVYIFGQMYKLSYNAVWLQESPLAGITGIPRPYRGNANEVFEMHPEF